VSETYTPGRNLGQTRTITVDRIPANEVTYEGVTDVHVLIDVAERVDVLVERALRSTDLAEQRITYTASDPASPGEPRPWNEPRGRRRSRRRALSSDGAVG
jgi:hypothetical protein